MRVALLHAHGALVPHLERARERVVGIERRDRSEHQGARPADLRPVDRELACALDDTLRGLDGGAVGNPPPSEPHERRRREHAVLVALLDMAAHPVGVSPDEAEQGGEVGAEVLLAQVAGEHLLDRSDAYHVPWPLLRTGAEQVERRGAALLGQVRVPADVEVTCRVDVAVGDEVLADPPQSLLVHRESTVLSTEPVEWKLGGSAAWVTCVGDIVSYGKRLTEIAACPAG